MPAMMDPAARNNMISLTIDDLENIIIHHLATGWFLFGNTVARQIEGLPMGSSLGSGLTRMVLIFLDIIFLASFHIHNLPEADCLQTWPHCRITKRVVGGHLIILLEMRYVDDYLALWKATTEMHDAEACIVHTELSTRLLHRYPLPLEEDTGHCFIGLELQLTNDVEMTPSVLQAPSYDNEFDYFHHMAF